MRLRQGVCILCSFFLHACVWILLCMYLCVCACVIFFCIPTLQGVEGEMGKT